MYDFFSALSSESWVGSYKCGDKSKKVMLDFPPLKHNDTSKPIPGTVYLGYNESLGLIEGIEASYRVHAMVMPNHTFTITPMGWIKNATGATMLSFVGHILPDGQSIHYTIPEYAGGPCKTTKFEALRDRKKGKRSFFSCFSCLWLAGFGSEKKHIGTRAPYHWEEKCKLEIIKYPSLAVNITLQWCSKYNILVML